MDPLLPDKVECNQQSKICKIIGRSAAHGDVAHHRLARDPAVTGMLLQAALGFLVLGHGDERHEPTSLSPFALPTLQPDLRFTF